MRLCVKDIRILIKGQDATLLDTGAIVIEKVRINEPISMSNVKMVGWHTQDILKPSIFGERKLGM